MTFTHPPRPEKRETSIICPYCGCTDNHLAIREGKHILACNTCARDFVVELRLDVRYQVFMLKEVISV